jgi:putative protease
MDFVGKCLSEYRDGRQLIEQRGKFSAGDVLCLLPAKGSMEEIEVCAIWDEDGHSIESAPHAQQKVWLSLPPQPEGTILMKQRERRK